MTAHCRTTLPRLAAIGLAALLAAPSPARADDRLDLVNTLQGTNSSGSMSHGGCLPLAGTPWGMTNWAPQSNGDGGWWFKPTDTKCRGLRATHQPSPWMGDYGQLLLMPTTGDLITTPGEWESPYDPGKSDFHPDYIALDLPRYDCKAELTPTDRCAVVRFTYNSGDTGRIMFDPAQRAQVEVSGRVIRGYTMATSGGAIKGFKTYFVLHLDRDVTRHGTFPSADTNFWGPTKEKGSTGGFVEFRTGDGNRAVTVHVGTSYIGFDQAEQNLKAECPGDFDATRAATRATWDSHLAKVDVEGGTDEQRKTFYTCLYRAQMFPHRSYELTAGHKPVHYSPYDGKVHPGHLYTDNGFWDVYRTTYPMWSILYPEQEGEILDGFVQAYKESGWLPQWPSPGHRGIMIGTHSDCVYADAVVKHIKGFDLNDAYAAAHKNAFVVPPDGQAVGRAGLKDYMDQGYIPEGHAGYALSTTLDYTYDDWCVAQIAKAVGKTADSDELMKRSEQFKKSWDPKVGFFRPHDTDGKWAHDPFDQFGWANGYVEGGPWQCTWAVPHDINGMADLLGGKRAMIDKLDRLFGLPPVVHPGGYGGIIHEMTEMAVQDFGQYDHGNQPGHHICYLYTALGQPWKTQYLTRRVCRELYNSGPDGFCGDEDNGEMASWYVLSSTGIFPLTVGKPEYTLTSPVFDRVTLHLPNEKTFTVTAKDNGRYAYYVKDRTLDGKAYAEQTIPHDTLVNGGEMTVQMTTVVPDAAGHDNP